VSPEEPYLPQPPKTHVVTPCLRMMPVEGSRLRHPHRVRLPRAADGIRQVGEFSEPKQ